MQKWTTTALIFTALAASSAQASVVGSLKDITGIPSAAIIAPSAGGSAVGVFGSFDLQFNFVGGGFTAAMTQAFVDAEAFWESEIAGYRDAQTGGITALVIDASLPNIDGVGGILGQAGANAALFGTNFVTPTAGVMQFDLADAANLVAGGTFDDVVMHEMAHVMGFSGFFWTQNGATDGSGTDVTYTGARGLAEYQNEFSAGATFIPVEDNGGPGTAFSHWDEDLFMAHLVNTGNSANPELMTGFLDNAVSTVSKTTLASFEDLGYALAPVPVPPSVALMLGGVAGLVLLGRRSRA